MAKSKKQQAAIAMSMKAAGKKPKMAMGGPGPKKTAFQKYVDKYPGSASDTTARFDPRYNWTNKGFAGERTQQDKDLKTAFTKTYGKRNMTGVDEEDESQYRIKQKMGGSVGKKPKMAKGGSSFEKLAPPYNKATYADKIAGAKKNAGKMSYGGSAASKSPKMKMGGSCGTPKLLRKGK